MAPLVPKTSLSKGTLGLKFMNRQAPGVIGASPAPASSAAGVKKEEKNAGSGEVKAGVSGGRMTFGGSASGGVKKEEGVAEGKKGEKKKAAAVRPTVIHSTSLLSFPLLSLLSTPTTTSSSSTSTSSDHHSYTSMPLTSSTISGRRSFLGANIEIEKLNDPSSHADVSASEVKQGGGESKSALKKRLAKEKERETVDVRGGARAKGAASTLSSAKTGKRTAMLDEERESGSAKKRRMAASAQSQEGEEGMDKMRWEADDDIVAFSISSSSSKPSSKAQQGFAPEGFSRPAGFEGAKKKSGNAKGKGLMGDHQWGKQGEAREWDAGKEDDSDSDDSESGSESEGEEDVEDEDAALFAAFEEEAGMGSDEEGELIEEVTKGKGQGKKGGEKGRQTAREEERFGNERKKKQVGGGGGGAQGKKVRR